MKTELIIRKEMSLELYNRNQKKKKKKKKKSQRTFTSIFCLFTGSISISFPLCRPRNFIMSLLNLISKAFPDVPTLIFFLNPHNPISLTFFSISSTTFPSKKVSLHLSQTSAGYLPIKMQYFLYSTFFLINFPLLHS